MKDKSKIEYQKIFSELSDYLENDKKARADLDFQLSLRAGKSIKSVEDYVERLEISGMHIKHTVYNEAQFKGFSRRQDSILDGLEKRMESLEVRKELEAEIAEYTKLFPNATKDDKEAMAFLLGIIEKYTPTLKAREDNEHRRINEFKSLINANWDIWTHFITLTFSENVTDIDLSQKIFKQWVRKMEAHFPSFVYCAVKEFQSRGATHYHVLVGIGQARIPRNEFSKVRAFWTTLDSTGNIDIKSIKVKYIPVEYQDPDVWKSSEERHIWSLGNYLTSYLKKGASDPRLFGKKLFTSSSKKKLKQKIVLTDTKKIRETLTALGVGGLKKKTYKVKERVKTDDGKIVKGENDIGEMTFYNLLIQDDEKI